MLLLGVFALLNLLLYGAFFLVAWLAAGWLLGLIAAPSRWARNVLAVALTALAVFVVPFGLNQLHRHQRAVQLRDDTAWAGSLTHTKTLAILTDEPEDHNWYDQKECGPLRCRALLYHHVVDAVLVALPPPIGTQLDPATPVIRYRLDHRAWCPPIKNQGRRNGRLLDQLMAAAAGDCLVSEPATLGDADVILLDQTFAPRQLPFDTPTAGITGERIGVYTRDGKNWRALYRDTAIGGADLTMPLYIGMPGRSSFGALLVGGPSFDFMTSRLIEPRRVDLAAVMEAHGLGPHDGTAPTQADMSSLARRLLADPSIPHASAAMQFLASYPWSDGWRRDDLDTVAAIIRDQRVTDFPGAPWLQKDHETPAELAQPIIDHIMASDLSGTPSRTECGQHCAVRILAQIFSLLPPGAAAPEYDELLRLAADRTHRPYAAAMFSRLADAGPQSLAEFEGLIQDGMREGHAAEDKTSWALGDGCMVPIALYGLARLGEAAKPAKMTALTAAKDDLAKAFCGGELQQAGELALLHMNEIDALKSVRPLGNNSMMKELDKNAVWEIGQCGQVFPTSSNECHNYPRP
jgi:hypothetical protein